MPTSTRPSSSKKYTPFKSAKRLVFSSPFKAATAAAGTTPARTRTAAFSTPGTPGSTGFSVCALAISPKSQLQDYVSSHRMYNQMQHKGAQKEKQLAIAQKELEGVKQDMTKGTDEQEELDVNYQAWVADIPARRDELDSEQVLEMDALREEQDAFRMQMEAHIESEHSRYANWSSKNAQRRTYGKREEKRLDILVADIGEEITLNKLDVQNLFPLGPPKKPTQGMDGEVNPDIFSGAFSGKIKMSEIESVAELQLVVGLSKTSQVNEWTRVEYTQVANAITGPRKVDGVEGNWPHSFEKSPAFLEVVQQWQEDPDMADFFQLYCSTTRVNLGKGAHTLEYLLTALAFYLGLEMDTFPDWENCDYFNDGEEGAELLQKLYPELAYPELAETSE